MAYKSSNDKVTILSEIKKNKRGDTIRTSSIVTENGEKYYDIRTMGINANNELIYTAKGVRFKEDIVVDVLSKLIEDVSPEVYDSLMSALDIELEDNSDDTEDTEEGT